MRCLVERKGGFGGAMC